MPTLNRVVPKRVQLNLPLVARQVWMPEVDEEDRPIGRARVHDLVLPRVVKDEALALLPLLPLLAASDRDIRRDDDAEVARQPRVCRAAVRAKVRPGLLLGRHKTHGQQEE